MIKVFTSQEISFKFYYIIFIFIGIFMTGSTLYNIDNNLSFARPDAIESNYQIKLDESYPSKMVSINNQIELSFFKISTSISNVHSNNNNNSINTFTDNSEFRQDISGKYTNPKFGISEFKIPDNWFATESMNGDNGIILTMLPGTTQEFFNKLRSLSNNETLPVMNLIVQDKENLKERQMSSLSDSEPSSFSTKCMELNSNSTSMINDKPFQISTLKCSTTDKGPTPGGIDFGHNEITMSYKYDSPNTIYVLQLVLSSENSSNKIVNDEYLYKFQPILDNAIQTLKIDR